MARTKKIKDPIIDDTEKEVITSIGMRKKPHVGWVYYEVVSCGDKVLRFTESQDNVFSSICDKFKLMAADKFMDI